MTLPDPSMDGISRRAAISVLILLMLASAMVIKPVFHAPVDSETINRFLVPFHLYGMDTFRFAAEEGFRVNIFRPLYGLSLLLDYRIWGIAHEGYHLTDLLLNWLVMAMAYRLFSSRFGRRTALLAVGLWAFLPVQFHSLVYLYGRNDRLLFCFIIGSLLQYDRAIEVPVARIRLRRMFSAAGTLTMGILAKDSALFYAVLPLAWSHFVLARGIRETLSKDRPFWFTLAASGVLYIAWRCLSSVGFGNSNLTLGYPWLYNLGSLMGMGLPFVIENKWFPWLALSCLAVLCCTLLCRRLPPAVRFGLFGLTACMLPMPFFWVQASFLWIPWLFGALALAGAGQRLEEYLGRRWHAAGRLAGRILMLALLGSGVLWSRRVCCGGVNEPYIAELAAAWLERNQAGPVYDGREAQVVLPNLDMLIRLRADDLPVRQKYGRWIRDLLRLRTGDPDLSVIWDYDR